MCWIEVIIFVFTSFYCNQPNPSIYCAYCCLYVICHSKVKIRLSCDKTKEDPTVKKVVVSGDESTFVSTSERYGDLEGTSSLILILDFYFQFATSILNSRLLFSFRDFYFQFAFSIFFATSIFIPRLLYILNSQFLFFFATSIFCHPGVCHKESTWHDKSLANANMADAARGGTKELLHAVFFPLCDLFMHLNRAECINRYSDLPCFYNSLANYKF